MKKILASAASLLLALIAVPPVQAETLGPDSCDGKPCFQVGSFNIEHLANQRQRNREDIPRRSKKTIRQIAKMITEEIDLEVVSLQEINTGGKNWKRLSKQLKKKGYRFIEGSSSSRNQFVVLAYDADEIQLVESVGELDVAADFERPGDAECNVGGQRRPVGARFRAGDVDFWVFGVHLKSKSTWGVPKDCPDWVREHQVRDLLEEIAKLTSRSGDADVILAGDFNAEYDEVSLAPLREAGFRSQMAPEFRRDGSGQYSYPRRYLSIIDHVMFRPSTSRFFVPRTGYIYPVGEADVDAFVDTISDHAPVWSSFYRQ